MLIQHQEPPDVSLRALRGAAEHIRPAHGQMVAMLKEVAASPTEHLPHPLYAVGLADMAGEGGLDKATITGWRYLAQSDEGQNYAFIVQQDADGKNHRFAEMNRGPFVAGTLQTLADAKLRAKIDDGTFKLSVLKIPALDIFALWLHAKDSGREVVTVIRPAPTYLEPWPRVYAPEEFEDVVRPEAKRKLETAHTSFV